MWRMKRMGIRRNYHPHPGPLPWQGEGIASAQSLALIQNLRVLRGEIYFMEWLEFFPVFGKYSAWQRKKMKRQ